ncbi:DNA topoisomerase III [Serratia fonticola]|uniref:DNA topoisomerase n=1 Tax=Serratia fonticola TaxID=47917 RepID=A0AAW3WJP8_SERFO|nr:DNA topoisomerase III [Serratia fonticola]MBC3211068.1 DNA topoisomerase III [Serratia fonticola]NYA12050.1 DNA topoisomerase III [Serratia fonticola]NYA31629.1 DNA topoisomerase III [Serratia fonticola]
MKLFLCEKPSQGRDIAAVLGATEKKSGYLSGAGVAVTWGFGHLLEQVSPEVYGEQFGKPWRTEVLPVLPTQWQMQIKPESKAQFEVIRALLRQADSVVIATDADREGEVIAREILDYCHYQGNVERLWLSALDETSVRAALAALKPGHETYPYYLAGLGRSRADWQIGMNLTRLYTVKARDSGYGDVLSVGRVQTPTLNLVVERDREIARFVPKPYFSVTLSLAAEGQPFQAQWVPAATYCDDEKRCIQPGVAQQVVLLCQQVGQAEVTEVETQRETLSAPLPFDLGTLQQQCSKHWGLGAQQVLDIAQALYETHKATTYPRTDCGFLPTSMLSEVPAVFSALVKSDPALSTVLAQLQPESVSRAWNDKKITAHHGIIPTKQPCDLTKMNEIERQVYQLIRQHYLAQFLPVYEQDATRVSLLCGGQLFRTRGNVVVVPGWKALFEQEQESDETQGDNGNAQLPALLRGARCQVTGVAMKPLQTKPPEHYTEGTLIASMKNAAKFVTDPRLKKILKENAGLGTEATRAGIIETLLARGFIAKKGKSLRSTMVAGELMDVLPMPLKDPGMTALWEQALDEVAEGKMSLDSFMAKQSAWTTQLVERGRQQAIHITAPPSPPCPACGGATQQRKGRSGDFWGCLRYPDCAGIVNPPQRNKRRGTSKKKTR